MPTGKADPITEPSEPRPGTAKGEGTKASDPRRLMVSGVRRLLPLVEELARTRAPGAAIAEGTDTTFSGDELDVLRGAATKLFYESTAVSSALFKAADVELPKRDRDTGKYPELDVLDAVAAVSGLRNWLSKKRSPAEAARTSSDLQRLLSAIGASGGAAPERAPSSVAAAAPLPPRSIRTAAMTQNLRSAAVPRASISANASAAKAAAAAPSTGCGCSGARATPSAAPLSTRNAEGRCEPDPFDVSCDTQVRLKGCLKQMLCDLLWTVESQVCVDGRFQPQNIDFQEVLGSAVCSLLRCVPEVLCPPETTCAPQPSECQVCDFAVEEAP